MIEFKVVATADKTQQAIYQHWTNELTIGNLVGDMIIDDPQMGEQQLRISIRGEKAIIENLYPDIEIRVNGKTISGPTELKIKDNLNIGRTSISFSRLDGKTPEAPEPSVHPQAANRFVEGAKEKAVLDALDLLAKSAIPIAAPSAVPPPPRGPGGPPPPPIRRS